MDGEIDLELYTVFMIRLNSALQQLDTDFKKAIPLFEDCATDLKEFYLDTVHDLNQDEINYNEYELFFRNGKNSFPQHIEILEETLKNNEDNELKDSLKSMINTFNNLNKIAEGMIK